MKNEGTAQTTNERWLSKRRGLLASSAIVALALTASAVVAQPVSPTYFPFAPGRTQAVGQDCSNARDGTTCISGLCIDVSPFGAVCSTTCTIPTPVPAPSPDGWKNPGPSTQSDASPDCTLTNWGCSMIAQGDATLMGICRPRRVSPK
jgi:hypothetical protein